jgi:hypothetical protein
MQEQETVLTEYSFTSITSQVYHPVFKSGVWYLVGVFPRNLDNIAYLCNIQAEDIVFLKLKYGG